MWIFGAATGGRPILFHALYCPGKTSLNGLAVANSASVASGTSTDSQSACEMSAGFLTRLPIFVPFAAISPSQAYCTDNVCSHGEPQNMKTAGNRRICEKAGLTISDPPVFDDDRAVEINVSRGGQLNPMLSQIDPVLGWIELDLHGFI